MSFEGLLPLPDYDGGPRDRLREMEEAADNALNPERNDLERPGYEYCCQWYQEHGLDSWLCTGWHDGKWTTLDNAVSELKVMEKGVWKAEHLRIVRRRKAGPVEQVDGRSL